MTGLLQAVHRALKQVGGLLLFTHLCVNLAHLQQRVQLIWMLVQNINEVLRIVCGRHCRKKLLPLPVLVCVPQFVVNARAPVSRTAGHHTNAAVQHRRPVVLWRDDAAFFARQFVAHAPAPPSTAAPLGPCTAPSGRGGVPAKQAAHLLVGVQR